MEAIPAGAISVVEVTDVTHQVVIVVDLALSVGETRLLGYYRQTNHL